MTKLKASSSVQQHKWALLAECAEVYAAHLMAGQWTLAICGHLASGQHRFGEFSKLLPGISERLLTLQLRKLEAHRLLPRTLYPEVLLRVEYALPPMGRELRPIIAQLERWGQQHRQRTHSSTSPH
ncbi:winged helix-turn-helix transcriptional regulator [Hymenobacter terrenus]|uniref:winged helix-turn-helix transcriptional regulator n=1 Tax=Hymenobacter terrenus TaxID=1629124 RepID=UPI0006192311|nr:winged helix-turn-helix transcriptional regulator [Hymenobacter terrenus]